EDIDIERTRNEAATRAIDGERGIDGLNDIAVADAQPLIRRLEFGSEVGDLAIEAAYPVEIRQQCAWLLIVQRRIGGGGSVRGLRAPKRLATLCVSHAFRHE